MYKRNIQRLTQTYLTLSLQDIANTAQINTPKEAEMHVLEMVTKNMSIYFGKFHSQHSQFEGFELVFSFRMLLKD